MRSVESAAADRLVEWMEQQQLRLGWQLITDTGTEGFALGIPAPHGGLLLARDENWELLLVTARGTRSSVLGSVEIDPAVTMDAMMFAVIQRATAERDHHDRTASVALAVFLKNLADELHDDRFAGRASVLMAGHAIKDGYELHARMRLEEAVRLFTAAGDIAIAGAESAQEALIALPQLLRG